MGNNQQNIIWPTTHPNPKLYTWPHLLTCLNQCSKGLQIARHNNVLHLIARTLQSNKHNKFYTLIIARAQNPLPNDITISEWLPECTCLAKLRPDLQCVLGAPNNNWPPITPTPPHIIQLMESSMEFTYCHNQFPTTTITSEKSSTWNHMMED